MVLISFCYFLDFIILFSFLCLCCIYMLFGIWVLEFDIYLDYNIGQDKVLTIDFMGFECFHCNISASCVKVNALNIHQDLEVGFCYVSYLIIICVVQEY